MRTSTFAFASSMKHGCCARSTPTGWSRVYDIGNSLAAIVRWVDRSQHWAAGHLAKAVRVIPGVVAAIPSALITLGWSAGLLS